MTYAEIAICQTIWTLCTP